jgi:hypothetical protein
VVAPVDKLEYAHLYKTGGWPALVIRQTVRQLIGRRSPAGTCNPIR